MYKTTGKAAKKPPWELSYERFQRGEHPQTIAMAPASGNAVKVRILAATPPSARPHPHPRSVRAPGQDGPHPRPAPSAPLRRRPHPPRPARAPAQTSTIIGHVFTALSHGRPVDLARLASQAGSEMVPPTRAEWEQLAGAEAAKSMDCTSDEKFSMTACLAAFVPAAEKPFDQRTGGEKEALNAWFNKFNWYIALRRAQIQPTFSGAAPAGKRPCA